MSILQISKIQQRSGNLVDLPQLDEAEFGWASDQRRLFIGKTTPNENIEIMTSYSRIAFSQIEGSVGNLNINPITAQNGQPLVFDGTNWVNRGGQAGGLIDLGNIANVSISGGAIGYVMETDGRGRLSWTPKTTVIAFIQNVTKANPGVITTVDDNLFVNGAAITITDARGMTQLNGTGNTFYANILTSNTFSLYQDSSLTTAVDTSSYSNYAFSGVTATTASTNVVTVGNSAPFTVNSPVKFVGSIEANGGGSITNLNSTDTYYVKTKPSSTSITVSNVLLANGVAGNAVSLNTVTSLSANVYEQGGRILGVATGTVAGSGPAAGSNTLIQYNASGTFGASAGLSFDYAGQILQVSGNANVGNLNSAGIVSGTRLVSTVATGTSPLQVTSTTVVPNLRVNFAEITSNVNVTAQTTGVYYPVMSSSNATGNYSLGANGNISFNIATGVLSATGLTLTANVSANNITVSNAANIGSNLIVTGNANVGNLGTARILASGNITTPQLISNIAVGTAPFVVTSTTQVANLSVATAGSATTATTAGTVTTAAQPNITSVGTLTSLTVTGNVTAGNLTTGGVITGNGSAISAINASNITTGVLAQGRLANSNVVLGSTTLALGSTTTTIAGLTSVTSTTFVGALTGAATSAGTATTAGTVTTAAQPNITSVGTLTSLAVTGNITAGNLIGPHANGNSNVNIPAANGNVNISAVGNANILVVTGTGVNVAGTLNATGNANVGNIAIASSATVGSNLTVTGNTNVSGNLAVTGNIIFTGANVSLGTVANLKITGGTSGFILSTDGAGNLSFANPSTLQSNPAGANTQIQFNDAGVLGASANFTFNKATSNLSVIGNISANNRIAIGTSDPAYRLDLASADTTAGIGYAMRIRSNASAAAGAIQFTNSAGTAQTAVISVLDSGALRLQSEGGSGTIEFRPAGTQRMVVSSTGANVAGNIISTSGTFQGNGAGLASLVGANVTGFVANANVANTAFSVAGANVVGTVASATSATSSTTATTATKALTLADAANADRAMTFRWTSQSGQPSWLWGTNDGINAYVWNPSNFNVNFASTAGSATLAGQVTNPAQGNITSVGSSLSIGGSLAVRLSDFTTGVGSSSQQWLRLPNGALFQWGSLRSPGPGLSSVVSLLPTAYTAGYQVFISPLSDYDDQDDGNEVFYAQQTSLTAFTFFNATPSDNDPVDFSWFTIGY